MAGLDSLLHNVPCACLTFGVRPHCLGGHQPARAPSHLPSIPTLEARRQSGQSCSASGQASCSSSTVQHHTEYAIGSGWIPEPTSKRSALRQLAQELLRAGAALFGLLGSPSCQVCLACMCFSPALSKGSWQNLKSNHVFLVGFWAWLTAQSMKIFTKKYKKGVWDIKAIVDSGGMPSSHSSLCMAVTTAVALEYGLASPLFAMSLCFSLIVMYDATGVRRHAGKQAEVLNIVLTEVLEGHPVRDVKLKEVLGHTPLQVLAGASLGILVGILYPQPALAAVPV